MKTKVLSTLFFLLIALPSGAGGDDEYSRFMEAAGGQSVLFRGHQAVQYVNFRYNGHYFWDSPVFRKGTVMLDGKQYENVYLNVDACGKELLAYAAQGSPTITLNRDDVEWFEIDGRRFVNLQRTGEYINAEEGFYLILKEGPVPVFMRVDKDLRSGTDDYNGRDGIGYDDPDYRRDILNAFICERTYYTVKKGLLKKIGRKKAAALIDG
ncbi:MAG: hypothetical protein MJY89_03160 [Bacteroidales bacterium]|nr:hypothetical protein [Bacteroidales bacterium]